MTALQQLDRYLKALERRLQLIAASQGAAVSAALALGLTVLLVWISNRYKFAPALLLPFRVLLFGAVSGAIVFALGRPVARLNRRHVARLAESKIPDLHQRLLTATEHPDPSNPFSELIAEDALRIARSHSTEHLASSRLLFGSMAAAVASVGVLVWMIAAAPGYWGYGAGLLWTGAPRAGTRPLYDIAVQPGDRRIRRKSDQLISAQLMGFSAKNVVLHAKYSAALKWEELPMQTEPSGNGYQLLFPGLSDSLEYWVQAGDAQSKHFTIAVKDLPGVKRVRVAVHYPSNIGLEDVVDDPGGDIRAVEGSRADVSVLTDKPLEHGVLVLENGKRVPLTATEGNWLKATLPITKDGSYHVAALDEGDAVRITDDYFIEAKKDEAPSVRIVKPGRDPHVSPIEEVPITVEAADDFGVKSLELHYSVNGGPDQTLPLAKGKSGKEAQGKTTLSFEDFKVAPGDLVSFYATARDATHTSRSDIVMAQAEAFDYKFRQSQQSGGGGGGGGAGDQGNKISERQKEIIAATWNQLKDGGKDKAALAENARFLSDLQGKLGEQAKALAERMASRELQGTSPEFEQFSKSMQEASADMGKAVDQLKPAKWNDALGPEQKALQSLLRAESIFRDIQVAFGKQQGGGGSGSSGQEGELARLFDLELDTQKNQYETGQSASPAGGEAQQKSLDEAMQRLKDLAKRQQELAEQQHSAQQQFQQRWEEEQLRREAEQLRQQLQQLAQNQQGQQGSPSSSQSSSSSSSQGQSSSSSQGSSSSRQSGQAGQSGQSQQSMRQAMESLRRAEDEMRNAVGSKDTTAQQRAASQLAAAEKALNDRMHQQSGDALSGLAQKAEQLAHDQKELADRVKDMYGAKGVNTARAEGQPGQDGGKPVMPEMSGPGYQGGYYRRRYFPEPERNATAKEKSLAAENDRLSEQMNQLQKEMQQQAQGMSGEQPEAARKLRKALSEAEQEELAVRMQKNGDWLRRGYGSQMWPMEDSVTAGTERLRQQVQEAQQTAANGKQGADAAGDDKMAQALAQVRSLREQLQRQSGRPGSEQGSQQGSQPGQAGAQSPGQGTSESAQGGQPGQRGGYSPQGGGQQTFGGGAGQTQDAAQALSVLRSQVGRGDRQLNNSFNDAIGYLRHAPGQSGLLDARINEDAVTSLERLELELMRRAGQQQAGARTGAPEAAPEQYRDALAEYFRTLSK